MKKIVVASKNPVKIKAALDGFTKMFPEETFTAAGVDVPSEVADQPTTDAETYQGAFNRAKNASTYSSDGDYYVGLEGGIELKDGSMEAFAWMVVISAGGQVGRGRTGTFFLPPKVSELVQQGMELGDADDIVFGKTNSKQAGGAIGLLTHDVIDRTGYYTEAIVFALIPFKNPSLFS